MRKKESILLKPPVTLSPNNTEVQEWAGQERPSLAERIVLAKKYKEVEENQAERELKGLLFGSPLAEES